MITDLPTVEDYYTSGKALLNFSWDIVANLLVDKNEADSYVLDAEEVSNEYWAAAKRQLATALSITQQGVEFILKGKIVEISPYLLIVDSPAKWPRTRDGSAFSFSDFRTVDTQDLIQIIETFSNRLMDLEFVSKFHELRKKRNRIMHSVDKNLTINVIEVIESLLFMHKSLFPNENWAAVRLEFLNETPLSKFEESEYSWNRVCLEMSLVIGLLKPSRVKEYFNIDKKQRSYICPECYTNANTDVGFDYCLAVLSPKGPESSKLYCPVCDMRYSVVRQDCKNKGCMGNVLSEDGMCLTCCG